MAMVRTNAQKWPAHKAQEAQAIFRATATLTPSPEERATLPVQVDHRSNR